MQPANMLGEFKSAHAGHMNIRYEAIHREINIRIQEILGRGKSYASISK